eukprot:UN04166
MIVLITFLLGLSCISGDEGERVWITNYMPEDNVNATDAQLGICFGSNTQWSTYPYAAALRYSSGSACCSASIISLNPGILLTAAHCNGCTGAARIGCNNPSSCDGGSYGLSQFIQHPSVGANVAHASDWINGYLTDWDLAFERDQNLTRALRMKKRME